MVSEPAKTAVVALNGFLGDRRGQIDVADIVNPRAIAAGAPHYTNRRGRAAHGGWNGLEKRRLRKWVAAKVRDDYSMVFVGKSYGAHWILDIYADLGMGAHNGAALLFDPAHTLTRGEGNARKLSAPTECRNITVVRQLGFRSGYRVIGAVDVVVQAEHTDIERQQRVLQMLDSFLVGHGL